MPQQISTRSVASFSLAELAVVMVIIAVIVGTMANFALEKSEADKYRETEAILDKIEKAFAAYVAEYASLPCPGDATYTTSSANFGLSTYVAATPACSGTTSGTGSYAYWAAGFPYMDIGDVPTKALQIPDSYAFDAWGRKIAYFMIENCSSSAQPYLPGYSNPPGRIANSKYNATTNFSVLNKCGNSFGTGMAMKIVNSTTGTISTISQNAILVLISYGKNGHGAYPYAGGATRVNGSNSSTTTISADEINNAQLTTAGALQRNAGVIVQKAPILKGGSTYFDDIVRYKTRDQLIKDARAINYLGNGTTSPNSSYFCTMAQTINPLPSTTTTTTSATTICGIFSDANCASYLTLLSDQINKLCF